MIPTTPPAHVTTPVLESLESPLLESLEEDTPTPQGPPSFRRLRKGPRPSSSSMKSATCELRWDFLEEERMKQYSIDKYFPQLTTKVFNLVGEPHRTSIAVPAHTKSNTCTQCEQGVVNPSAVTCKIKLCSD